MVRFSDMLGGNDEAAGPRATTAPNPVPTDRIPEADAEAEADPGDRSPEAVLDRLTQYATSARVTDPEPQPSTAPPDLPETEAATADDFTPVGDDLLPHGKAETRKRRRK